MGPAAAAKTSRKLQSLQPGWNPCPPFFHRPPLRSLIVLLVHLFALVFQIHNVSRINKKKTPLGNYQCQTLNIGINLKIL